MDTLSGVTLNAFGDREAPSPYGMWFDGAWDNPRLDDPGVCQGLTDYAMLLAAGPPNKFAIDWSDAVTLFQQGKAAFFIDASLFGPGFEDPDVSLDSRQDWLQRTASAGGRRQFADRTLAVGTRYPQERPEQGRGLVLHPVLTNKANTAELGKCDRWSAAAERLRGPGLHRSPRARVRGGGQ